METALSHSLQSSLSKPQTKRCALCKADKPRTEFWKDRRPDRDLGAYCRECRKTKGRKFRAAHRERLNLLDRTHYAQRRWKRHLRAKYGITPEQYDAMLTAQGGVCAICKGDEPGGKNGCKRFHVDHQHGTTNVRGLLCSKCNQMLGYADDTPEILRRAAIYLERAIVPQVAAEFVKAFSEIEQERQRTQ